MSGCTKRAQDKRPLDNKKKKKEKKRSTVCIKIAINQPMWNVGLTALNGKKGCCAVKGQGRAPRENESFASAHAKHTSTLLLFPWEARCTMQAGSFLRPEARHRGKRRPGNRKKNNNCWLDNKTCGFFLKRRSEKPQNEAPVASRLATGPQAKSLSPKMHTHEENKNMRRLDKDAE